MGTTIRAAPALATLVLRPLPLPPLQPLLSALLGAIVRQHPGIFERLGEHAGKRFGIIPTDMPFAIVLDTPPEAPRIVAVRRLPGTSIDARIAGPLTALVGLASGTLDGDALFFSRDLTVEGDVAAIVALRNAVDDAGVDLLSAAASCLGPFGRPFEHAARLLGGALAPLRREWN